MLEEVSYMSQMISGGSDAAAEEANEIHHKSGQCFSYNKRSFLVAD